MSSMVPLCCLADGAETPSGRRSVAKREPKSENRHGSLKKSLDSLVRANNLLGRSAVLSLTSH